MSKIRLIRIGNIDSRGKHSTINGAKTSEKIAIILSWYNYSKVNIPKEAWIMFEKW